MTHIIRLVKYFTVFLLLFSVFDIAYSQENIEPELAEAEDPLSPLDFDIRNGIGFRVQLNNFGFAVGGEYRRVLSRYTKGILEFQITNIKDEGEQTFQNFWGQQVIPNKYNRILAFPLMIGMSRRFFAEELSDNFRLFAQFSGGPSAAFVYPYYDHDLFGYGFRLQGLPNVPDQRNYDPFQGWGEGHFLFGGSGHLSIGADVGGDFGNIQTVRIGYLFHYYPEGIQVMEPNRPGPEFELRPPEELSPDAILPAADEQYFFGSPHITLVFGSMW